MKRPLSARHPPSRIGRGQRGYVLLVLLMMMAILIIAAAAVVPTISFEIRRDREQELIHRGVQYSRAIRIYYKKFGRYPTRIEDLQNTNNLRFLRKRYKDPITGQDFKLLHFGEVKLTFSAPLSGASNLNSPGSLNAPSPLNSTGVFGSSSANQPGGVGLSSPSGFGAATRPSSDQNSTGTPDQNANTDANQPGQPQGQPSDSSSKDKDQLSTQVFGGGPIVGVISTSKKQSIREFNHKKKYNEWQFIYDPATDRGGLLNTPNQPPLQPFNNQPGQPGQQGTINSSPFGTQPTQGNYPGQMNANPNPTNPNGSPTQPPNMPPDQH